MSESHDSKLEALLRSRSLPAPSADLAERIARAALDIPQRQPFSVVQWISQLFAEFRLPSPAVALGATLIVGVVAGWVAPFDASQAQDPADTLYVESFLYPEEEAS